MSHKDPLQEALKRLESHPLTSTELVQLEECKTRTEHLDLEGNNSLFAKLRELTPELQKTFSKPNL
jgi:hypothetical protein